MEWISEFVGKTWGMICGWWVIAGGDEERRGGWYSWVCMGTSQVEESMLWRVSKEVERLECFE